MSLAPPPTDEMIEKWNKKSPAEVAEVRRRWDDAATRRGKGPFANMEDLLTKDGSDNDRAEVIFDFTDSTGIHSSSKDDFVTNSRRRREPPDAK